MNKCPLQQRCLIISDLDGTLLNDQGLLTNQTKKIIKKVIEQGHIFCIATGRPWRSSKWIYDALELNTFIANLNGSVIQHPYSNDIKPIKFVFSSEILKTFLENKKLMQLVDNIYVEDGEHLVILKPLNEDYIAEIQEWFHVDFNKEPPIIGLDYMVEQKKPLSSILMQIKPDVEIDEFISDVKELSQSLTCQLWSLKSNRHIIEVNTNYANKGNALKYFASYYGIPIERTYAFGDGDNDYSMLSIAKNSFAVKNAKKITKFISKGVIPLTNSQDGVAHKLKEIFNLDQK